MRFGELPLPGAFLIEPERHEDERGFFGRAFCQEEFAARGLDVRVAQCNIAYNRQRHTLRGLHYQADPHGEAKLVRVTRGRVFAVAVDLRPDSPAFARWHALELDAESRGMLFMPEGVANGYLTLCDDVELFYQMSVPYRPEAAGGVRWDDPALGIRWPVADPQVSERDLSFPDFDPGAFGSR